MIALARHTAGGRGPSTPPQAFTATLLSNLPSYGSSASSFAALRVTTSALPFLRASLSHDFPQSMESSAIPPHFPGQIPGPRIQAICRWQSEASLRIYARLGLQDYTDALRRALRADISSVSTSNLPQLDGSREVVQYLRDYVERNATAL